MKKFIKPEITVVPLRTGDVMTGVLRISAERSSAQIVKIDDTVVQDYNIWKEWNDGE